MAGAVVFERDESHWLHRYSPDEWLRAAMAELGRAESAFAQRDSAAGVAATKRAGGMALNAALIVVPREDWGRSFTDHLQALGSDPRAPAEVRSAALEVYGARPPGGNVIELRTQGRNQKLLDAARTVMAHAYAVVHGSAGRS